MWLQRHMLSGHVMSRLNSRDFRVLIYVFLLCLALPVGYLWLAFVQTSYEKISTIEREQRGLSLSEILVPHLLFDQSADTTAIVQQARDLDVEIDFSFDQASLPERTQYFATVMNNLATKTGLAVDDTTATSYLIATTYKDIAQALSHFSSATVIAADADAAMIGQEDYNARLIKVAGHLAVSISLLDQAQWDLSNSCACPRRSERRDNYAGLRKGLDNIQALVGNKYIPYSNPVAKSETGQLLSDNVTAGALQTMTNAVATEFNDALLRIKSSLTQRKDAAWSRILLMSVLGLFFVLCGLVGVRSQYVKNIKNLKDLLDDSEFTRKRAELMHSEMGELNTSLAANLDQLNVAQSELLRKSRFEQLGQLTATIAHEIRNPMGAIRTSAFLISKKVGKADPLINTQFQRINNGIARCDKIISQLLDYSRTKKIDAAPGNLDDWIAEMMQEEVDHITNKVHIICDLGIGAQLLPFDPTRLRRALMNLILNAVDAMQVDAADAAGKPQPTITISTKIDQQYVAITVTDNGPGIPPDHLQRIFEPLFTTKGFGTGLGLPAVEQIAQQHGGKLEVISTLGVGASFTIYLALLAQLEVLAA